MIRAYIACKPAPGPQGSLPLSAEMLRDWPSGDLFGLSQNAGMGWPPQEMLGPQMLILSTQGGVRAEDGTPIALGYHTGHWEVGLLVQEAARTLKRAGAVPFAAYCSDPCDGRTQGTPGMFDSLPYRNDAAMLFRRLIRSLPARRGVLGVATCDKGLPAMMMALAGMKQLPACSCPAAFRCRRSKEKTPGKVQSLGARYAHGEVSLEEAAELSCRACASPGGGCQFLGTAATSQVIGEALGMTLPHAALAPSGQPIWLDLARRSATALYWQCTKQGRTLGDVLTDAAVRNAMIVHAACGGSTNLLLHLPAIAHAAGLRTPTVDDWHQINLRTPRIVDALPNGPVGHPTVRVFLAGGVPEIMLQLRELDLLDLEATTVAGCTLGRNARRVGAVAAAQAVARSAARGRRRRSGRRDHEPGAARERGLTPTVCFPRGNLAPEGSIVKSTAIDPRVGRSRRRLSQARPGARLHARARRDRRDQRPARRADSAGRRDRAGRPRAAGLGHGRDVSNHVGAETFGLGPRRGGRDRRTILRRQHRSLHRPRRARGAGRRPDRQSAGRRPDSNHRRLQSAHRKRRSGRRSRADVRTRRSGASSRRAADAGATSSADDRLPDDTRLWAALQAASGGAWAGCVYDVERIIRLLEGGAKPREGG